MGNKPRDQRDTEIIKQAVKRVNEYMSLNAHNIQAGLNDLRMLVDEDHWKDGDTDFEKTRKEDGRPCLIMNRLPGFVSQVIGDLRANRPSCKCHPADNKGTIDIADILEGRIRNIEAESTADAVYDNGAEQAAKCSFGAWRVVTEYGDEDNFYQRIRIKAIYNQFAVVWDPMSQEWDKTDAEWCAVLSKIHKDTYKEKYKGKSPSSFDANRGDMHWYIGDTYTLCEYFRRENDGSKTLYMLPLKDDDLGEFTEQWMDIKVQYAYTNGQIVEELPETLKEIWPKLLKDDKVKQRKVQKRKIMRYLLSGHEILEEPQEWVSNIYWPIVPVVGKLTNIDGKVYTESVIRKSKDAQKAYNFGRNTAIEDIALVPKAPYMVTPDQIKGFEPMWKMALKKTFAFLYYNKDPKSPMEGPPQRIQPVQASTAITESTMLAVDEMRATTNVFDPGMQQASPDMSGKAILARVSRSGVANYEFIDNVGRSIALTWRILLDIIPKVEDTQREVRLKKPDGTVRTEKINWANEQHRFNPQEPPILNDLTLGRYDVTVTVGPSYATQRIEAAENMVKLLQVLPPNMGVVLGDEIVRNFDWHGAQEAADRMKAWMVKQGMGYLFKPEDLQKIMAQMANVPPEPPSPMIQAKMQQEKFKTMKAEMEVVKKLIEMKQLNEGHIFAMLMKVEEAGRGVLEREQQAMMQPRPPQQAGEMPPQGPMSPMQ